MENKRPDHSTAAVATIHYPEGAGKASFSTGADVATSEFGFHCNRSGHILNHCFLGKGSIKRQGKLTFFNKDSLSKSKTWA